MTAQMDVPNTSNLMSVISTETPIDVTAAFVASIQLTEAIIFSLTLVYNLSGLTFLQSRGQTCKN